jgi:hypothetical protein
VHEDPLLVEMVVRQTELLLLVLLLGRDKVLTLGLLGALRAVDNHVLAALFMIVARLLCVVVLESSSVFQLELVGRDLRLDLLKLCQVLRPAVHFDRSSA